MRAAARLSGDVEVNPRLTAALHSIAPDGRVMHTFTKVDGVWTCACGATRDRFGQQHS